MAWRRGRRSSHRAARGRGERARGGPGTERISVSSAGQQANSHALGGGAEAPRIAVSDGARYVAWWSDATNLVARDTNRAPDVFVRDRRRGTTARVSVGVLGRQGDGASTGVAMSRDGRLVAFDSSATNLVPGDTNAASDVFVRDRDRRTTTRVSVGPGGRQADQGVLFQPSVSADGRVVVFASTATNLVRGDTNDELDVFARDLRTGITTRVSVGTGGVQANARSAPGGISADGRYVVFRSNASNLVPGDTTPRTAVYVNDRRTRTTTRVDADASDVIDASAAEISGDGRLVAYERGVDVLIEDRDGGAQRCVVCWDGTGPATWTGVGPFSVDGARISIESMSTRLVPGDTDDTVDAYARDVATGATTRVSVTAAGAGGNGRSLVGGISPDGRWVAFSSAASNLVAGDTNRRIDVFLRGPLPAAPTS